MAAFIPSWRGISAVVLALFVGLFLPALMPARGAPIRPYVWLVGPLALFLCAAASGIALFRKARPDRIAGVIAGILTLWMIYGFYNAIS